MPDIDFSKYANSIDFESVQNKERSKADAMARGASELGIDPVDYATAISYESARTFDPWAKGPVTKWGQHRGTIQYGEPQRKEYGVYPGQSFEDQVTTSNVKYLKDKGIQPGMAFPQIYAAINGGSVSKNLKTKDANTGRTIADNIRIAEKEHRPEVEKRFGHFFTDKTGQVRPITPPEPTPQISFDGAAPQPQITQEDIDAFNTRFPQFPVPGLPAQTAPAAPELQGADPNDVENLLQIGSASANQQKYLPFDPSQEASFQAWLPTMNFEDSPETRQMFMQAYQQANMMVPSVPAVQGQKPLLRPGQPLGTEQSIQGEGSITRQFGKTNDDLTGIAYSFTPTNPKDDVDAIRQAILFKASQYDITSQQVDAYVAKRKAAGDLFAGGQKYVPGAAVPVSFGILADIKGDKEALTDLRMEQAQSQPGLVTPKDLHVGENWQRRNIDWIKSHAGQAVGAINPLLMFLPEEDRNRVGSYLAGGALGSGGRNLDALAGLARPFNGDISQALHDFATSGQEQQAGLNDDTPLSKVLSIAGGAPGDLSRLYLMTRIPAPWLGKGLSAVVGMAADQGLQSVGRQEDIGQVAKEFGKGVIIGSIFAGAPSAGRLVSGMTRGVVPESVATAATIGLGTAQTDKSFGASTEQSLESGLVNVLLHLVGTGINLRGKTVQGQDSEGNTVTAGVDPDGSIKLLKGRVEKPDVEMYVDVKQDHTGVYRAAGDIDKTTAQIGENPLPALKSAPQGNPIQNPAPSDIATPLKESGLEATRIDTPHPADVQAVSIDTRARKITEVLKGKDFTTVEEIAKAAKVNKVLAEDAVMKLYGAGKVEMLPGNRIRLIDESQAVKESDLYEKAKNYGQTPEVSQSPAPVVPGQNVPTQSIPGQITDKTVNRERTDKPAVQTPAVAPDPSKGWLDKVKTKLQEFSPEEQAKILDGRNLKQLHIFQLKDVYADMERRGRGETTKNTFTAPIKRPRSTTVTKHQSLSQAVRALGGIKTSKWDKGEGQRISNKETGSTGLINNKSGTNAELMAGTLWDLGYLRDIFRTRADVEGNILMQHVEDDVSGVKKHYAQDAYEDLDRQIEAKYSEDFQKELEQRAKVVQDNHTLLAEIERQGHATNEQRTELERSVEKHGLDPAHVGHFLEEIADSARAVRQAEPTAASGELSSEPSSIFGDAYEPEGEVDTSFDPEEFESESKHSEPVSIRSTPESKPNRPTLHGVPPQELDPQLTARVLYAKDRKMSDDDTATRYNLTPEQVASVGALPAVGQGGQMSFKLIQSLTPSKTATSEETADKIAKVNDLVSELNLPVTNRVTRDTLPGEVKATVDAIRLAIAKEMGQERGSHLTPVHWLDWLNTHAEKLEQNTVQTILESLGHQIEHIEKKVNPFLKDKRFVAIVTRLHTLYDIEKIPDFDGIPNADEKRKIKELGYEYGLKETAIKRGYQRGREELLKGIQERDDRGRVSTDRPGHQEQVAPSQSEKGSGKEKKLDDILFTHLSADSKEAKLALTRIRALQSKSPQQIINAAKFGVSPEGVLEARNYEALDLILKAVSAVKDKPSSFTGAYMNAPFAVKVRGTFETLRNVAPGTQDSISRILKNIDRARGEGDLTFAINISELPELSRVSKQEELSHRNNARSGARKVFVEMAETPAIKKGIAKLGTGYDNIATVNAVDEVIAKSFRDDAETELGLSADEIDDNLDALLIAFDKAGINAANYAKGVENVSTRGKRFAENIQGQRGKYDVQADAERTAKGGDLAGDSSAIRKARTDTRPRTRTDSEDDRLAKLRQTELHTASRGPAELEKHEKSFIKSATTDLELRKDLEDDVLFSKPKSWGSINIHGKSYDLTKTKGVLLDLANAPRAIKASTDLSAAGRQGLITSVNHPIIAARAFAKQLTMLPPKMGAQNYERFKRDLDLHPFIELAEASKLHLTSLGHGALEHREEAFLSRILGDDPYFKNDKSEKVRQFITFPIRASERAYVSYLDFLRINSFTELAKEVHKYNLRKGKPDDPAQYEGIATFINRATGRGSLGKADNLAPVLGAVFFSPRYWASRLQVMNPAYYRNLPPGARKAATREMVIFIGAVAGLMVLLKAAGFKVEFENKDNPDLIKLRLGNYTYDFTAGLVGHLRYAVRMVMSVTEKDPTNNMTYLTGRYLRSKLAPLPAAGISALQGKNYIGEPTSVKEEAAQLIEPIMIDNFYDAAKGDGTVGLVKMTPEFFGISTTRYKTGAEYRQEAKNERTNLSGATLKRRQDVVRRMDLWEKMAEKADKYARP